MASGRPFLLLAVLGVSAAQAVAQPVPPSVPPAPHPATPHPAAHAGSTPPPHTPPAHAATTSATPHGPSRSTPTGRPAGVRSTRPHQPGSAKPPPAAPAVPPGPAPAAEAPAPPTKGTNTGLPLPRFVSLRGDTVNFRAGPGRQYPIEWVYQRRDLPVEIEREFDNWRLVEDFQGSKGWVNQATLAARRTGVVVGGDRVLRSDARDDASAVVQLKAGVVVRLRACAPGSAWCQASVQDYRGWIRRSDIWGLLPNEEVQ